MGSQYKSRASSDPDTDSEEVFYCRKNWQPEIIQTELDLIWLRTGQYFSEIKENIILLQKLNGLYG